MDSGAEGPSVEVVEWAKGLVAAPLTGAVAARLAGIVRDRGHAQAEMAAWALGFGEIALESQRDVLRALLDVTIDDNRAERLRGQAAEAVGEQLQFSSDVEARAEASDLLTKMLSDGNPLVRFWSAFALGKLGATSALPALRRLTADEAFVAGWWTVGEEAADAIDLIEGRTPPPRKQR